MPRTSVRGPRILGVVHGVIESETDMEVHSREALRIAKALAGA